MSRSAGRSPSSVCGRRWRSAHRFHPPRARRAAPSRSRLADGTISTVTVDVPAGQAARRTSSSRRHAGRGTADRPGARAAPGARHGRAPRARRPPEQTTPLRPPQTGRRATDGEPTGDNQGQTGSVERHAGQERAEALADQRHAPNPRVKGEGSDKHDKTKRPRPATARPPPSNPTFFDALPGPATAPASRTSSSRSSTCRPSCCRSTRPPASSTASAGRCSRRSTRSRPTTAAT